MPGHMASLLHRIHLHNESEKAAAAAAAVAKPAAKGRKPKTEATLPATPKKRKDTIPTALRESIWIHHMGRQFEGKCRVPWCQNNITVFDFQAGHNLPESKGGPTTFENLVPICGRCNLSMGNRYTISEWSNLTRLPTPSPPAPQTIPVVEPRGCCSLRRL